MLDTNVECGMYLMLFGDEEFINECGREELLRRKGKGVIHKQKKYEAWTSSATIGAKTDIVTCICRYPCLRAITCI